MLHTFLYIWSEEKNDYINGAALSVIDFIFSLPKRGITTQFYIKNWDGGNAHISWQSQTTTF